MPPPTSTTPPVSLSEYAELLRAEFGIEGELVPLTADRGATYAVVQNGTPTHVVKIGPVLADADRARLDLQAEFLRWARGTLGAVRVPLVVPDRQGRGWHPHTAPDGSVRPVQVTTWVPGDPLSRCRSRTPALLRSAGRALASATLAMAEIPDSLAAGTGDGASRQPFAWDLLHGAWIVPELERSPDPVLREFLPIARRFVESTLPTVTRLPQQLLHNDWNDDNILVTGPSDARQVTGLIDLGDMVRGPAIVELGIGLAYLMLDCSDPLMAACHVIEGYRELRPSPLADEELNLLWNLIRMRWALSAVHAQARRSGPAGDAHPHHQVSQAPIRRAIEATGSLPDGVVLAAFRRAAGVPPVPHRDAVLAHLRKTAVEGRLVPVMGNLNGAPVLDLSASSPDAGPGTALDAGTFTRWTDAQCATHPSGAAIGRWNEPRLLYQSRGFGEAGAVGGTARTVHIGLDIFCAEGTPVRAPLDAVVFTVADNAGDLDYGPTVVLEHGTPEGHRFHTLHGHLSRSCLTELAPGTALRAGAPFAAIGEPTENGGWPPHLHLQLILMPPEATGDYPGVAPPDWRTLWTAICPNPAVLAGLEEEAVAARALDVPSLVQRRNRLTGANLSLSYAEPLVIVRGEAQYLYDHEGRRFLDGVNNVAHVGHCHRRVVAALSSQAAVLNTNTRYLHPRFLEYTERLTALFPDPLEVCFLVNSGSEANELALRLARAATGRCGVVAMRDGYHGNSGALIDISGYKHLGPGGQGTPSHVRLLDTPGAGSVPDVAREMARACAELAEQGVGAGAFFCEPILSCAGQVVLPAGYLKTACAAARSAGALCVIDEVQTGLGRVGTAWWAFEEQGIVPDIVTLGKPLGNGHPMGAVITTRAIADAFANGMEYFNTFGGNPVSCAVGLAVLDVIEEEGLRARAVQLGARLQKGLLELAEDYPLIGEVRGRGLFLGVECVDETADRTPAPRQARNLVERMKEEGVLLSTDGPHHNVIKIKPPLVLEERDVDRLLASMRRALES